MQEMTRVVTLWLAWYRERAAVSEESAIPRRVLRLRMLHASSREEACLEMRAWLEHRGLSARDLERLEPSPYGLCFQPPAIATLSASRDTF